jgi:thymidylate synthase
MMIDEINELTSSTGEKGWPVAVKDRIAYPNNKEPKISESNVAVTFLWTMRDAILPKLEKENLALATNFYTPSGLVGMIRNILSNPYIRYIILLGEEYSSKDKGCDDSKDLTSANALRVFFEKGINEERKLSGFEQAIHFDKNIPTELIKKVAENVELIDLNKTMPNGSFEEKIIEANRLMKTLDKKQPFIEKPCTFEFEKSTDSFPYEGGAIIVHGSTIPKTWIEIIHKIYRYGKKNLMNADTDRWVKEINNIVAVVHDPQNTDLSINPFLVPLTPEKIQAYQSEILSPLLPEGKAYTYGNKLRAYLFSDSSEIKTLVNSEEFKDFEFGKGSHLDANINYLERGCEIDQVKDIVDALKRDPYSKATIAMTWHPADELMRKHKSSPCLVLVQAMVQDEKLNLTTYWRSHDMVQGWPENAYGIAAIQKEISEGINVKPGELTLISNSAQIYNHYYAQVEEMLKKYKSDEVNFNDLKGNFIIKVKDDKIIVTHIHPTDQSELEVTEGSDAADIIKKLASKAEIDTSHALYLGKELMKAELALHAGVEYTQDEPISIDKSQIKTE